MTVHEAHPVTKNDPLEAEFEMSDGRFFRPFSPKAELMVLPVIATALSNSCRFGGHISDFYSTAQHSVLVALLAPDDLPAQRAALMHDADETFGLPDMLTPIKRFFPDFVDVQNVLGDLLAKKYNFTAADHARIKPADRIALILEKRRLKNPRNEAKWMQWAAGLDIPTDIHINPLDPKPARALYLDAFDRVFNEGKPILRSWLETRQGFEFDRPKPYIDLPAYG